MFCLDKKRARDSIFTVSGFGDISGCSKILGNCARLCYYARSSGNSLPTFRVQLIRPVKGQDHWWPIGSWPLMMGPPSCPEASVRNDHQQLRYNPVLICLTAESWNHLQHSRALFWVVATFVTARKPKMACNQNTAITPPYSLPSNKWKQCTYLDTRIFLRRKYYEGSIMAINKVYGMRNASRTAQSA